MKIIVIAPTYRETSDMLEVFENKMEQVGISLKEKGHSCEYYFLSDGQWIDLKGKALFVHKESQGLAYTLLEGYEKVLKLNPDIVVRIDTNEDDPFSILEMFELLPINDVIATFRCKESKEGFTEFMEGLKSWDQNVIEKYHNVKFPCGCFMFQKEGLKKVINYLKKGSKLFEEQFNAKMTWGLDLFTLLISSKLLRTGFMLGFDNSSIWIENQNEEKSREQADRAQKMIQIAKAMEL